MIFLGDVAIAKGDKFLMKGFPPVFQTEGLCLNLEGSLTDSFCENVVYNNLDAFIDTFRGFNVALCCLANNHIDDLPDGVALSIDNLNKMKIPYVGAGATLHEATQPSEISGGCYPMVMNFGWEVIGCNPATRLSPGVNRFAPNRSLEIIKNTLESSPKKDLVVIIHGNYEFEAYPQSSHRRFAIEAIALGVRAVIFHHSHLASSIEVYKKGVIAYGLGNWAFSYQKFISRKLAFPDESFLQMAVDIRQDQNLVHIAEFNPELNEI